MWLAKWHYHIQKCLKIKVWNQPHHFLHKSIHFTFGCTYGVINLKFCIYRHSMISNILECMGILSMVWRSCQVWHWMLLTKIFFVYRLSYSIAVLVPLLYYRYVLKRVCSSKFEFLFTYIISFASIFYNFIVLIIESMNKYTNIPNTIKENTPPQKLVT